jgi:hypothetical protein
VIVAAAVAACGARQPVAVPPPPGTEQDIAEAERLGRIMFVHDTVAADATDALVGMGVTLSADNGFLGWITVPEPDGIVVRFVGELAGRPVALYDVGFSAGPAVVKRLDPPAPLPRAQVAAFYARQTAIESATLDCSNRYNTVVFQDPMAAGDDWYVYLLPATTVTGRVVVGRQLRLRISEDGARVLDTRALSKDCMYVDRTATPAQGQPRALIVTSLVSPVPNESHVFLNLHERLPVAVATSLGRWMVVDGKIEYFGPHQ